VLIAIGKRYILFSFEGYYLIQIAKIFGVRRTLKQKKNEADYQKSGSPYKPMEVL